MMLPSPPKKQWLHWIDQKKRRLWHVWHRLLQEGGQRFSALPRQGQRLWVAFFVLVGGMGSLAVTWNAFQAPRLSPWIPLSVVRPVLPPAMPRALKGGEGARLQAYQRYLDSLQNDPGGRRLYDSLLTRWPHLRDTLAYLERLYQP